MYLLFCGDNYYPSGGAKDYLEAYTREDEAIQAGNDFLTEKEHLAWANVFCTESLLMVWKKEVEIGDATEERYSPNAQEDG